MRAVIVSSSYSYLERVELLRDFYTEMGYETSVVITNFVHAGKKYIQDKIENYIYIPTKSYHKNISFKRMYSHYCFARDAFKEISKMDVDLLHILLPANSLAKEAAEYKQSHPDVKLYMDIIDLWPETLPIKGVDGLYPLKIWKKIRDDNLEKAERIYSECDLYRKVLGKSSDPRYRTVYWAKKEQVAVKEPNLSNECIHLCYLGSINNIIDIPLIVETCLAIQKHKRVKIHIIGDGERREQFLEALKKNQIDTEYYGVVYDDEKKMKIFGQCHFGLNIMKTSVCVGLTMKSLDYFRAQLPVINSIPGDTASFVEEYEAGFNDYHQYIEQIDKMELDDYFRMRENAKHLYEENFTKEAFFKQLQL